MDMESFNVNTLINISVMLAVFILPFVVGVYLAKAIRMVDYGWKIGLIFSMIAVASFVTANGWPPKLGVDLAGGVVMIYEIDQEASQASRNAGGDVSPAVVATALRPRLNPSGSGDIVIRPYGDHQIEIVIPKVDADEVENIQRLISTSGYLEFRILVNRSDQDKHAGLVELAEQQRNSPDYSRRQSRYLYNPGAQVGVDTPQATWVKIGLTDQEDPNEQEYKVDPLRSGAQVLVRDGETGNWITFDPATDAASFNVSQEEATQGLEAAQESERGSIVYIRDTLGIENAEVLVATNSVREVQGKHLAAARMDTDLQTGSPAVSFTMNAEGSQNMAILTSNNVDDQDIRGGLYRYLGIVLDGTLLSAPRLQSMIADRGQITGQFTREEVNFLVNILRAGRLPAVLNPNPTSVNQISPLLGQTTIEKGSFAIGISMIAVLIFMAIYYRFAGIVACMALTLNLLLIVGIMILFKAAFTLPGLAGLVLTVGMSVDANVLIFERIREERNRGSALRMAIRNGFGKATTTIVDANLTTLITAVVLYGIGTDQIRGFALTLIFGILMSMLTAIFCSRVVFDIAERKRWLSDLSMMRIVGDTSLNFIGKRSIAGVVSAVLIVAGLAAIVVRGADIFDIDFTGGTSAQIVLKKPMDDSDVRERVKNRLDDAYNGLLDKRDALLDERLAKLKPDDEAIDSLKAAKAEIENLRRGKLEETITGLSAQKKNETEDYEEGVMWKIDTSIPESDLLQQALAEVFRNENGESLLVSHHLDVADVQQVAYTPPVTEPPESEEPGENSATAPGITPESEGLSPAVEAAPGSNPTVPEPSEETPAPVEPTEETPADDTPSATDTPADEPAAAETPEEETPAPEPPMPEPTGEEPMPEPSPSEPSSPQPMPEPAEPAEAEASPSEQPAAADPRQAEPRPPVPPLGDDARRQGIDDTLAFAPVSLSQVALLQEEPDQPAEAPAAPAEDSATEDQPAAEETPSEETPAEETPAAEPAPEEQPAADSPANADRESPLEVKPQEPAVNQPAFSGTRLTLEFDHPVSANTVLGMVQESSETLQREVPRVEFVKPTWDGKSKKTAMAWTVQMALDKEEAQPMIANMQSSINGTPVFLSVSKIGGSVAGKTRDMAIAALAASLLGIVAYIWFRFQKVVYGLAAVVALVHDVLITVGAIAISAYLAPAFGFLMVEEFKISLPIVAALLTIIGYSLNDTIVVFDRIREVKGKNPSLTGDMINSSINQTLSRTLLTSLTTLIVVLILYALGGEGIHGFAFALMIGVFVGTYSSVFVASPVLLWLGGDKSR